MSQRKNITPSETGEEKQELERNTNIERQPSKVRVRIPQLKSIETAIRLYYERIELSNSDIKELFGSIGSATISKLKKKAEEVMTEENITRWNTRHVNTEAAYKAWGLDIADLERRQKRLVALAKQSHRETEQQTRTGT